jgi:hypothetical protein
MGIIKIIIIFAIWMVIAFLLACAINLAIWGAFTTFSQVQKNFWVVMFTSEWSTMSFIAAGIFSAVIMYYFYDEVL